MLRNENVCAQKQQLRTEELKNDGLQFSVKFILCLLRNFLFHLLHVMEKQREIKKISVVITAVIKNYIYSFFNNKLCELINPSGSHLKESSADL